MGPPPETILSQQVIQIESLVDGQKIRWFNISLLLWSWLAMFADLLVRGAFFIHRFLRGAWRTQKV